MFSVSCEVAPQRTDSHIDCHSVRDCMTHNTLINTPVTAPYSDGQVSINRFLAFHETPAIGSLVHWCIVWPTARAYLLYGSFYHQTQRRKIARLYPEGCILLCKAKKQFLLTCKSKQMLPFGFAWQYWGPVDYIFVISSLDLLSREVLSQQTRCIKSMHILKYGRRSKRWANIE